MLSDTELLRKYATERSESAFTELVQRHINMVYAASLRETHGNSSLAEEIAQAVFAELARKASSLVTHPALAGWLYTSVRHMSANLRRSEERRQRREQKAYAMNEQLSSDPNSSEATWQQLRPVLDDVMHDLSEADRAAVVLRFFEERSLKDVGLVLNLNENAARMRVDRALEKMRSLLAKKGITSTASGLTAALAFGAAVSAPSNLAAAVSAAAMAGAASTTASGTLTIVQVMSMTKIKVGVVTAIAAAAVVVPVLQEQRVSKLTAENEQLKQQLAELPKVRQEMEQLRRATIDPAELERLRGLQSEVLQLRARVNEAQRSQLPGLPARTASTAGRSNDGNESGNSSTNQFPTAMSEMMKGVMEQQLVGRLTRMKEKLNLTPEQEQGIRDILTKQAEQGAQFAQKMMTGKQSKDEMTEAARSTASVESQIKALLSPEQQEGYKEFKKEEAVGNARLAANAEMLQLQNALGLSQEQQDQIYTALYDYNVKQLNPDVAAQMPKATDPAAWMEFQMEQKTKSLEGILSPTQMQTWRQMQESQLKFMKAMTSGGKSPLPGMPGGK